MSRMQRNWNTPTLIVGTWKDTATVQNSLMISYKVKYKLKRQLSTSTPRSPPKDYIWIFTAAFSQEPQSGIKCTSFDEVINKMWFIYKMGHYTMIERNRLLTHAALCVNIQKNSKLKETDIKGFTQYGFMCMKCREKKSNLQREKEINLDLRVGAETDRWGTKELYGMMEIF